jgi:hypothetical protein
MAQESTLRFWSSVAPYARGVQGRTATVLIG